MSAGSTRFVVIHDRGGRILALAPLEAPQPRDGVRMGWRPVLARGQVASEVELTEEQLQLGPRELLERCRVRLDRRAGGARLEVAARGRRSRRTPRR